MQKSDTKSTFFSQYTNKNPDATFIAYLAGTLARHGREARSVHFSSLSALKSDLKTKNQKYIVFICLKNGLKDDECTIKAQAQPPTVRPAPIAYCRV
ncbi:MAG: hypothetical protein J0L99_02770 [Chitinophagales bacterium]|nr:hypothetical protein [Chitinophagales bacterium]